MTKPDPRYTFREISELATQLERSKLELKNSTYVLEQHSFHKSPLTRSQLREKCKSMLGKEVGAFANSAGGTLVIGLNDKDGTLDSNLVPKHIGEQKVEDWIANILSTALEPPLQGIDCYALCDEEDPDRRIVVISVSQSWTAHQSTSDKLYYVRRDKSADPADHWVIEAIRNRQQHPKIGVQLKNREISLAERESSSSGIFPVKNYEQSAILTLTLVLTNEGDIMAKEWALLVRCRLAKSISIGPSNFQPMPGVEGSGATSCMVAGPHSFFPSQRIELGVKIVVPASWSSGWATNPTHGFKFEKVLEMPDAGRMDEEDAILFIQCSIFADNSPPAIRRFELSSNSMRQRIPVSR